MSKSKSKAVALRYNAEEDSAPVVIASGYGSVADRIIDIAEQRGIPVFRDDSAASIMCMLEVGTAIPEELYQVVASIYVQIMNIAADLRNGSGVSESSARGAAPESQPTPGSEKKTGSEADPTNQEAEEGS
ncbi:MAG: hypothetical protein HFJ84_03160 [Clostridiales bacterium]|jgi:flagellar biosynthesis protein|nr:hypothetical protein [Clostridiales bacterium]